jgi:hypothetical protein
VGIDGVDDPVENRGIGEEVLAEGSGHGGPTAEPGAVRR